MESNGYHYPEQAKDDRIIKFVLWACGILLSVNLSVIGYAVSVLHGLDLRVANVEASRFTNVEAKAIYKQFGELKTELALIPKEHPPKWYQDYVVENRARIKELEKSGR